MKLRNFIVPALVSSIPIAAYLISRASATPIPIPQDASLYMHIKHQDPYPRTLGSVQKIYNDVLMANRTGRGIGLEPQIIGDFPTQKAFYQECGEIPTCMTMFSSDLALQHTLSELDELISVTQNLRMFRFHEVLAYYDPNNPSWAKPFPLTYCRSLLQYAKDKNIPVFWNEWDINAFTNPPYDVEGHTRYSTSVKEIITGYEDNVIVSYGTNGTFLKPDGVTYYEPAEIYQLYLQQFQRRGASVQSWYWWERNGRQNGYEFLMPPELMRLHTIQAFQAGCEMVQYEPFGYFFNVSYPKITLSGVLGAII